MTNQEMRELKERYNIVDYEFAHRTGVRYDTIVDFFKGKIEDFEPGDREKIEEVLRRKSQK